MQHQDAENDDGNPTADHDLSGLSHLTLFHRASVVDPSHATRVSLAAQCKSTMRRAEAVCDQVHGNQNVAIPLFKPATEGFMRMAVQQISLRFGDWMRQVFNQVPEHSVAASPTPQQRFDAARQKARDSGHIEMWGELIGWAPSETRYLWHKGPASMVASFCVLVLKKIHNGTDDEELELLVAVRNSYRQAVCS